MDSRAETFTWTGSPHRTAVQYRPWSLVVSVGELYDAEHAIEVEPDPDGWEVRADVPSGTVLAIDYIPEGEEP